MNNFDKKDFIAYEYLSLNVKSNLEPLYIDCYENFGWILVHNAGLVDKDDYYLNHYNINNETVNIKFKRDRKIKNKLKLVPLQKQLEISLKKLEKLEKEPTSHGVSLSITVGIIGIIFIILSIITFSKLKILGILCAVISTIGLILPYFIYKDIKAKYEQKNIPLIESEYDKIYESCKTAKKLLN